MITFVAQAGSTNTDVAALLQAGERALPFALATFDQRAGRGRAGASWVSAPGRGLAMSIALAAPQVQPSIVHPVGLAVRDALRARAGAPVGLAWPNDIVIAAEQEVEGWGRWRKIAGILCEWHAGAIIAGIGVNLAYPPEQQPSPWATSLYPPDADAELLGRELASDIADRAVAAVETWRAHDGDLTYLLEDIDAASAWRGQQVRARQGETELAGVFLGVEPDGAARIGTPGGIERWISGEVRHVRM